MARYRTVKPEHWDDKKLPNVSLGAHLLWIGMWNFSDDKGVIENDPIYIKSNIFPRRKDVTPKHVEKWLNELIGQGFIIPFKYNEESFFITRTFSLHQKIDKPTPSKIPDETIRITLSEWSENNRRVIDDESRVFPMGNSRGSSSVEESSVGGEVAKSDKSPPHLFKESEIFDKKIFCARLAGTQYENANVDYYHERALNWSESKGAKKKNWLSAIKNWMTEDMTEGHFITKDFIPPKNGTAKNQQSGVNSNLRQQVNDELNKRYQNK